MQEGHFDSEGNYFIKKDQEIRDNWLDNIDWVRHIRAGRHDDNDRLDGRNDLRSVVYISVWQNTPDDSIKCQRRSIQQPRAHC